MATLASLCDNAAAHARHWTDRIENELDFAAALCDLHPREAKDWRPLVERARAVAADPLASRNLEALPAAVAEAEAILAPLGKAAKRYVAHCVGHAHIDMNWMWSWPETVSVTLDTFLTVLRLMEEFPAFHFSQSQASTYRIVEEHRPDLLARIARRVAEGRWEVTASHWVEGDKNIAAGEALCRHLLYTRQYLRQLFKLKPEDVPIDWSPDTFGHAATVPTYLVRGGVRFLYLHRPGVHTKQKPGAFWWQGPDGSRVLVRNDMELGYNGQIRPGLHRHLVKFVRHTGGTDFMFVYGVGDHGGGPTRRDILCGLDLDTWPIYPQVRFSTARRFFECLEKQATKLPVVAGELNTEFTGCYTTQTLIKRANRFAENRLVDAEFAASLAWAATGQAYPVEALETGWRDSLFSHFHDILPGSGVHDTRTYTHGLFQKTMAATGAAEAHALRRLASLVDTAAAGAAVLPDLPANHVASAIGAGVGFRSDEGEFAHSDQSAGHGPRPFVIFNPCGHDRDEIVEATIWDTPPAHPNPRPIKSRQWRILGPDGGSVPAQVVGSGGHWGHDFAVLAFPAAAAGLGYGRYIAVECEEPAAPPTAAARHIGFSHHCGYALTERSPEGLENDLVRVELDPRTGAIRSFQDKRNGGAELIAAGASASLEYAVERPHGMTAWCIDHTDLPEAPKAVALRRSSHGPHKAGIEVDVQIRESRLTLGYELRAGDPRLHLSLRGTWFERGTRETGIPSLRFALPLAFAKAKAQYEIPFGAITRDLHRDEEVPALSWAAVAGSLRGKPSGCLLLNDSKHGYALDGGTLRLTLIRSSYDPDPLPEIGKHEMRLALLPFTGELDIPTAIRAGQDFNRSLRVVGTDVHKGKLPASGRFLEIESESAILGALKKAEDGSALVARVFNPTSRAAGVRIAAGKELGAAIASAAETDLLERSVKKGAIKISAQGARISVPPHAIASVTLKLKKR